MIKFSSIFLFLVFLFSISKIYSQNKLKGIILNEKGEAIPFCALGLLNTKDSSLIKGNMTSEKGEFVFENISPGSYIIKASSVGFIDVFSSEIKIDSLSQIKLEPLILKNSAVNLNEVSVTVMKKMMEFKNGNITVNIEGSPLAAGNTVYELLTRLPGVMINGDNISLNGNTGVRFMIDDRLQQFSGPQLISLLKSMNAASVEKIEIIKNPSVKYDASGSGGLINIVTRKVKITGFSGNALLTSSQGIYITNYGQLSLNYKAKKITVFTNFNADYSEFRSKNYWRRDVTDTNGTTTLVQNYTERTTNKYVSFFLGGDWFINKKNTLSVRVNGRPGKELVARSATTNVSNNSLGYNNLAFNFQKPNSWFLQDYSLGYEHLFDTVGTKLFFNSSYSYYPDVYRGFYQNHYLDENYADNQPMKIFKSINYANVTIATSKVDFEKKMSKTLSVEAGAKGSYQTLESDFTFENMDNGSGNYILDTTFTNSFFYHEQILAGYLNFNKEIKKFNFQVGLRGENTTVDAGSKKNNVKYNRNYFNLFPVASINYNANDNHHFQVSYNRRINRVDYNSFNPYKSFRSILTVTQGNPYQLPQYTNNFQISHTYKGSISNSLSYSKIENYFLSYYIQNNTTKELIFYTGNLKHAEIFSYSFSFKET